MSKFVVGATWDDVPHLTPEQKAELWGSIPPYQRDARSKGIPQLGSGAIYPVPESEIVVDPFELPLHWPRGYGLDVGCNADFVLLQAADPIEAVRLRAAKLAVVRRGRVIAETAPRRSRLALDGRPDAVDPAAYAPKAAG